VGGGFGGGAGQSGLGAIIARVTPAGGTVTGGGGGQQGGQVGGGGQGGIRFITSTNMMEEVQAAARNFFITVGVDLSPPKALFFNDRAGVLLVRATLQDLDMIEAAMQVLCSVPPQVNIKSKFVEIGQDDVRGLGFDWYLGNFLLNNRAMGVQGGTAPSFGAPPSPANPGGVFPGSLFPPSNPTTIPPQRSDQLLTGGLRNPGTALFTLTGILTDPQFRLVIKALEQRSGVDVLSSSEVTVISGRQAQMKATDVRTVLVAFDFSQAVASGGPVSQGGQNQFNVSGAVGNPFVYPVPQQVEQGPVLDVVPNVLSDGYTINLTLIPTLTEFADYDNAQEIINKAKEQAEFPAGTVFVPTVLPRFTVRQVVTTVNVWDGQTVVLGGLISDRVTSIKDKVPVLGDLPLLGRFFRSEQKGTTKKNLVIFVTPTMIDPAGNRLHTDEEMPFALSTIPPQPKETGPVPIAPPVAKPQGQTPGNE
jgi:general secretion pathway protein D